MSLALQEPQQPYAEVPTEIREIERWLERDPTDRTLNLASGMYDGDVDDARWKKGHSSDFYYVKKDERATFELIMRELTARADNLLEMGVGGADAVQANTVRMARHIGARQVFGIDLSRTLAEQFVDIVETEIPEAVGIAVISDMYQPLPIVKPNSLVSVLGQEIGNLENFEHPDEVEARLVDIFTHYANAVTSWSGSNKEPSHLVVSYDANRNVAETRDCYLNDEFGGLVRSRVERV